MLIYLIHIILLNLERALANDLGFVMQHTGLLIPYYWDVEYDMTYTEK